MTVDLILAIGHHVLVFGLAAILAAEFAMMRATLGPAEIGRLAQVDRFYGAIAGLVILVGVLRVFFGIKGAGYYLVSFSFWAKMAAFVAVALLSIQPTRRFAAWRSAAGAPGYAPPADEVASVRRSIHIQAAVFILIPIFAAAMARGF